MLRRTVKINEPFEMQINTLSAVIAERKGIELVNIMFVAGDDVSHIPVPQWVALTSQDFARRLEEQGDPKYVFQTFLAGGQFSQIDVQGGIEKGSAAFYDNDNLYLVRL